MLDTIFGRGRQRASYRNRWRERKAVKRAEAEKRQIAYDLAVEVVVQDLVKRKKIDDARAYIVSLSVSQQTRLSGLFPAVCPLMATK